MKKFIPYIFITSFMGAFLALSFYPSFAGIPLGPKAAEAQMTQDQTQTPETPQKNGVWTWVKDNFGLGAWVATGKDYLEHPQRIIPGQVLIQKGVDAAGDWGAEKITDATIGRLLVWISDFTWFLSARIFNLSTYLLDYAVDFSVKDFKKNIENIGVIDQGYKIILNVANMIFIFILLYIAIQTILGLSGSDIKKLLTHVIVVALFINFSLFMTKVIIDASNIVAMGFYNAVRTEVGKTQPEAGKKPEAMVSVGSISTTMMAGLRLQSQMPSPDSVYNKTDPYKGFTNFNIAMNQLGGSTLFLVSAFAFFSAAFLFITRFIALLFYMLFSPVAFLGILAPEMFKEYSSKWWKGLQSQAIFAPVFLFMVYLISSIVNSGQLWAVVGGSSNPAADFYDAFSSSGQGGSFPIIMNYVILISLMIGGLIAAKAMAAQGSAGMVAYADKVRGWAQGAMGRNTIGRAAYLAGNSTAMANLIDKSPIIGEFVKTKLDKVAGVSFGGRKGGYEKTIEDAKKQKKKIADFVAKTKYAKTEELVWEEEDTKEEKLEAVKVIKQRLKKPEEEASKIENDISKTNKEIEKLEEDISKAEDEYKKLKSDALAAQGTAGEAAANNARDSALQKLQELQRDSAILENVATDKIKDKSVLENAMSADKTMLKKLTDDIKKSQEKIDSLNLTRKNSQNTRKRRYLRSLPFRSWGAEFGFLDKIFPSYVKGAEEIRKGKSDDEKTILEMIKKQAKEMNKKEGGESKEKKPKNEEEE